MIVHPATVLCNIIHGSAGLNIETFKEVNRGITCWCSYKICRFMYLVRLVFRRQKYNHLRGPDNLCPFTITKPLYLLYTCFIRHTMSVKVSSDEGEGR